MRYSDEELDCIAQADARADLERELAKKEEYATKISKVLVAVFKDLEDSIYSAAMNCKNNDASTALYEVHGSLGSMDIAWHVREALEVAHPSN